MQETNSHLFDVAEVREPAFAWDVATALEPDDAKLLERLVLGLEHLHLVIERPTLAAVFCGRHCQIGAGQIDG